MFYDGFLPEITTDDTIDKVSSKGFALGYLGGGLYLAIALGLFFMSSDEPDAALTEALAARIAIFGSGIWWFGFSLFALARLPADGEGGSQEVHARVRKDRVRANHGHDEEAPHVPPRCFCSSLRSSSTTAESGRSSPFRGRTPKTTLNLDITTIGIAFLIVQLVAFVGALMFGIISGRTGPKKAIMIALVVWTGIAFAAFNIPEGSSTGFMALAAVVGFCSRRGPGVESKPLRHDDPRGSIRRVLRVLSRCSRSCQASDHSYSESSAQQRDQGGQQFCRLPRSS